MSELNSTIDSTEDDIQFLYQTEPVTCQLCSTSLLELSLEQRHAHYDCHHPDQQSSKCYSKVPHLAQSVNLEVVASSSTSSNPLSIRSGSSANTITKSLPSPSKRRSVSLAENIFWFQSQSAPLPDNFTPGLIPTLKHALTKTHAKGVTLRAILCNEGVTHVAGERWDRGWGCGYRNFLMACTALINQTIQPLYFPLLDHPMPPGVRNLQYWIEDAWADGFDRDGAKDLRHKLVGTKKWIGTAELYVAFVSRGIPAKLVDFPKSERGPEAVTEWIMNYFSPPSRSKQTINAFHVLKGANPVISTELMPLILQHSGHSRTVVGFEVNKKGEPNLLVFDPSRQPNKEIRRAALARYSRSSPPSSPSKYTDRKRRASNAPFDAHGKRVRSGLENPSSNPDREVIVIDDEHEEKLQETLDANEIVQFFRVSQKKLGKKDRYQILYFPLDPPLEIDERWSRRVVTSEIVQ